MEDKTAKEIAIQLKRIADALEKSNKNGEVAEKRTAVLEKLQEKNLRADLRGKTTTDTQHTSPNLD